MSFEYDYELGRAADIIARGFLQLKAGETCVITADTESDLRVVSATARAVFSAGAKPMVVLIAAPLGIGRAADPMIPRALAAALVETDAWIEYGPKYINYSAAFDEAKERNKKLRHLCLEGMTASNIVRCIGRIDFPALEAFMTTLQSMIEQTTKIRVTTPAGQDVHFENKAGNPITTEFGRTNRPGSSFQPGVIAWTPDLETVSGVIVFDGAVNPPIGILHDPICLTVEKGAIQKIEGGKEAAEYETWLRHWNHPQMLKLAHTSIGCNPEAKLSLNNSECERVWGTTQWGIGHIGQVLVPGGEVLAPSHSDGICLDSSIWFDGEQIMKHGQIIHPRLSELAGKLGK